MSELFEDSLNWNNRNSEPFSEESLCRAFDEMKKLKDMSMSASEQDFAKYLESFAKV